MTENFSIAKISSPEPSAKQIDRRIAAVRVHSACKRDSERDVNNA